MNRLKTEITSVEGHKTASKRAIAQRAYALYEMGGFKDGLDLDHWLRAEWELVAQDVPMSFEADAVTVRMTAEQFSGTQLLISISPHSLLILRVPDEESDSAEKTDQDILQFISFPVEIDPPKVTCELNSDELALKLPFLEGASEPSQGLP
jgi:hypothetical protein